jgi:hypothetical protein
MAVLDNVTAAAFAALLGSELLIALRAQKTCAMQPFRFANASDRCEKF